jgi:uncharacterized protein YuzE
MRITYDSEADALHIRLVEGIHQCRCLRLNDWVTLDIGPNESLVGIEVIDASEAPRRRSYWRTYWRGRRECVSRLPCPS